MRLASKYLFQKSLGGGGGGGTPYNFTIGGLFCFQTIAVSRESWGTQGKIVCF